MSGKFSGQDEGGTVRLGSFLHLGTIDHQMLQGDGTAGFALAKFCDSEQLCKVNREN
jgi:hypothetical protein